MDLLAFRDAVRVRTGHPAGDALFPDDVVTQLVNTALHHLETEHDWPWLEVVANLATVAGDDTYEPPADWLRSVSLHNAEGYPLERQPQHRVRMMVASGRPKAWAVVADEILVRPTPAAPETLTHVYVRTEDELVEDIDTPEIPAVWHHVVVEYAAYLAFRREGNQPEAGGALAAYEQWVEQMKERANRASSSDGGGTTPAPAPAAKGS